MKEDTTYLSPEECERTIMAFLRGNAVFLPASSPGLAVRIENAKVVLEWHGEINPSMAPLMDLAAWVAIPEPHEKEHSSTGVQMDLAVWDESILKIPGPPKFSEKDVQRWYDFQWKALMKMSRLWNLQFGPPFFINSLRPNMIGYLMRKAMIYICGEQTGEEKWKQVRALIPVPDTKDLTCFVWECDGSSEKHPSITMSTAFDYPFECRIGPNGLAIMQPPPDLIAESIARTFRRPSDDESYIRGDAEFLKELASAFGFSLKNDMPEKTAVKILEDRLGGGN